MIRSLPLTALSLLLGFFFVFVGMIKVTPRVNEQIYADMKQEFGRYNKVFPLFKLTNWRPLAKNFRLTVGIVEVAAGSILVLIPGPAKEFATVVLLILTNGAFYTHHSLNDSFERIAPCLVFGLLLVCRLVICYQVNARERKEEEFLRKLYEETNSIKEDEEIIQQQEENDLVESKKTKGSSGASNTITNKKNVSKHSYGDREEKKIK